MSNVDHLRARRRAQAIEHLARRVRWLRKRGKITEAEAEVSAFECGDVLVLPSSVRRQLEQLVDADAED